MGVLQRNLPGFTVDEFVAIIRSKAEKAGISITELAERAGVTRPYLHRVLARKQEPSLQKASQIAAAVGLSIAFRKKT